MERPERSKLMVRVLTAELAQPVLLQQVIKTASTRTSNARGGTPTSHRRGRCGQAPSGHVLFPYPERSRTNRGNVHVPA